MTKSSAGGSNNVEYALLVAEAFSLFKTPVETQNNGKCKFCYETFIEYDLFKKRHGQYLEENLPVVASKLGLLVPYSKQLNTELRAAYGSHILH